MSPMGIYDRDYFQKDRRATSPLGLVMSTAIGTLILVNVLCYIAQLIGADPRDPLGGPVTRFLAASPHDVFHGHVYKLLTANFAHAVNNIWHIFWNMLFLYFFGKELEQIYGKRRFLVLYLLAGVLSILAEVTAQEIAGHPSVLVLGASGAVMAVVVLFTLFYPNHQILFFFFIPAPVWVLCLVYVGGDLYAVLQGTAGNIASFAHLAGAAFALLYRLYERHGYRLRRLSPRLRSRAVRPRPARAMSEPEPPRARREEGLDPVSQRIDDLLAKIHAGGKGMEGLTHEEQEFLRANSRNFKSK